MITAVDTNILFDLLLGDPTYGSHSTQALRQAAAERRLVACAPVWAETCAGIDQPHLEDALDELGIHFDALQQASAALAGQMWAHHRARGGGRRARVVADFLIGAHALRQADRLLTRDRGFYRDYFESLTILDPAATR